MQCRQTPDCFRWLSASSALYSHTDKRSLTCTSRVSGQSNTGIWYPQKTRIKSRAHTRFPWRTAGRKIHRLETVTASDWFWSETPRAWAHRQYRCSQSLSTRYRSLLEQMFVLAILLSTAASGYRRAPSLQSSLHRKRAARKSFRSDSRLDSFQSYV